jgi:pimeloyl-ACP methyl ester carboxylesterase
MNAAPLTMEGMPSVDGVTHRFLDANGVRLHIAEAGSGPPLILLHGWPQHWWCWRMLIPDLAERYRVIAPDLRGFGWSGAPQGSYAKSTFAADVLALLDLENLDRVRVVGHDWGGYTAFLVALEHPERIQRMVALDITPPWRLAPQLSNIGIPVLASYQLLLASPLLGRLALTSTPAFVRALIRAGSGSSMQWSEQDLDQYASVLRDPDRARASSSCYRTFITRELAPGGGRRYDPQDLRVPTKLVMGSRSAIHRVFKPTPSKNLRVQTIHGAGHFLPEEAPIETLRHIQSWIA